MFGILPDVIFNYYSLIGVVLISYLVYKILDSFSNDDIFMQTRYKTRGHTWRSIQCNKSIPYNIYCCVCSRLMLPLVGLFCECCGVSACRKCHKVLNKRQKCKVLTWSSAKPFPHLWVKIESVPSESSDHTDECYQKYFCSWCQRTKISLDLENNQEACDFQKYRTLIVPPTNVVLEKGSVIKLKPSLVHNWRPLFIFANRKSGSNQGDEILSIFRGLLNPIQVVDLSRTTPESVVQWMPPRCRVLVAGGDGTVAWVLGALAQTDAVHAPVGILPMGTGNDLSRVLGWGAVCSSPFDAEAIINTLVRAREQPLDRWKITINPSGGRLRRVRAPKTVHAYNYASIGVDAQVALDFHEARKLFLYRYASRTVNFMAYLLFGASRAVSESGCSGLERWLQVQVSNRYRQQQLPLPELQALVVLNIPSWGGGVDLWSLGDDGEVAKQSVCDGKFELVGISSSFHIARLRCGLAEPYRFTQATKVKIELSKPCAMQVDGEPWMQAPATITVEQDGQALLLRANDSHQL